LIWPVALLAELMSTVSNVAVSGSMLDAALPPAVTTSKSEGSKLMLASTANAWTPSGSPTTSSVTTSPTPVVV
jgi:hypothetical protein